MTNNAARDSIQTAIYSKGFGTYRGWIVELDLSSTGPAAGHWMAGTSLRTGVQFTGALLPDVLNEIDRREDF